MFLIVSPPRGSPHADYATTVATGGISCDSTHSWSFGLATRALGLSQSPEIISWFINPPNYKHMQTYANLCKPMQTYANICRYTIIIHSTSIVEPGLVISDRPTDQPLWGPEGWCAFHLEVCHSHGLIEGLEKVAEKLRLSLVIACDNQ